MIRNLVNTDVKALLSSFFRKLLLLKLAIKASKSYRRE
jgi:hypothetical protein